MANASANSLLQSVQTYQMAQSAIIDNTFVWINKANKQFKDFQNFTGQLGDTVTYDLQPRFNVSAGLVANFQSLDQRFQSITCGSALNCSYTYTSQQFIFQINNYLEKFARSSAITIGSQTEADLLRLIDGTMVYNDPQQTGPNFGQTVTNSGPYRFFGDGETDITSYEQLSKALYEYQEIGYDHMGVMGLLPMNKISKIVGTGQQLFTPDRGNETAKSWMVGEFQDCNWYKSNLLPTHIAGRIGANSTPANRIITVTAVNFIDGQGTTQITYTEPTGSTYADAFHVGDLMEVVDGTAGYTDVRALTFVGNQLTSLKAQAFVTSTSSCTAGAGTVNIRTFTGNGFNATPGKNQNINTPIVPGMKIKIIPTHKVGVIWSEDALRIAMPRLDEEVPYPTSNKTDPESGLSIRSYYGSIFGQNQKGIITDNVYGGTLLPEKSMRLVFTV